MKTLTLGILLLISQSVLSQVLDNFNDSDLLINPKWQGQLNDFYTKNGELNSSNNTPNSLFYVSTPSACSINSEWQIDIRLLLNTSSLNYVDIVLMSDSLDITKMKNGYFVRLGGTADEISLYKIKGGAESKLIDGADNVLNTSNNCWRIRLTRQNSGDFSLQRQQAGGTGVPIAEGTANDSDILTSAYCGIRIRQSTSSFFGKHFFDNLYVGKIIKDTIPPVLDSIELVYGRQLICTFNEACDSSSLVNKSCYRITQGNPNLLAASFMNEKQVLLEFQNAFQENAFSNLEIRDVMDKAGNIILPIAQTFYYSKPDTAALHDLMITELMADPDPAIGLPNQEYVEITNISDRFIQLKGCKIHDPTSNRSLPDKVLAPDSIIILTNIPSLNNAGDMIWLTNQHDEIIHKVSYTDLWYKDKIKMNGGWSLEMINERNICTGAGNWRASIDSRGGTPGKENSVKGLGPADIKAPSIVSVIPVNDSILHIVFDEEIDSFNSLSAQFSVNGSVNSIKLIKMAADGISGDWLIGLKPNPDSVYQLVFSGIRDCSGNSSISQPLTLQWPSISKKYDLVFNEILFNPKTDGYDYIEIYNNTPRTMDLSKHFIAVLDASNQYKSIEKISPTTLFLAPYQYLLLSKDNAMVCEQYNCKIDGALKLDFTNMPSMPDDAGNLMLLNISGKVIDSLTYSDTWHFPLISDREGVSLERISFTTTARIADNWHSAASVAGFGTPGYINSQSASTHTATEYFSLENKSVSPDEDGFEDILLLKYHLPDPNFTTSINIYDIEGRLIKQWVNNETLGSEGFIAWNGTDNKSQKALIGMYILDIFCTNIDGSRIREKMSFTVAGTF